MDQILLNPLLDPILLFIRSLPGMRKRRGDGLEQIIWMSC